MGEVVESISLRSIVVGLLDLGKTVLDFIMTNSLISIMFAGSLVGVACYVISKVKRTAKH